MGPSERRDRESQRRQQSKREPKRDHARLDRRRERDRQQRPEQPIDGKWYRRAKGRAGERSDEGDNGELEEREGHDARARRADGFQNRQRCALALDEALRCIGDADAADNQRQQSGQGEELGELIEIATEIRGNVETRASLPSGLRKGPLGLTQQASNRRFSRRAARPAHDDAGRPANKGTRLDEPQSRRSAACEMRTRGPRPTPVAKRSGSLVRMVQIANFASPMRMTSPSLRFRRASSASSAAAPNAPSFSDSASSSGIDGAKTAAPIRGHDGSTALSSTSAASSLSVLAMARIVATVDSEP